MCITGLLDSTDEVFAPYRLGLTDHPLSYREILLPEERTSRPKRVRKRQRSYVHRSAARDTEPPRKVAHG